MYPETIRISKSSGYACPLAGLQIDEPAIELGSLLIVKFNRHEWEFIERRYIFKDWFSQYNDANPVFVYKDLDNEADIQKVITETDSQITRLITAFHLHKYGYILDPIYTLKCFYNNGVYDRLVGPYRTEYLAAPIANLRYTLKAEEQSIVNGIYETLTITEKIPNNELVLNLLNNFNLSFLPTLSPYFSLNTLYTIIEMLYGRISPKLCTTTSPYERSLAMINVEYGLLEETDKWQIFFTKQIHQLRNIVHHHKKNNLEISFEEAKIYLQESIRLGIRMLIRIYILKSQNRLEKITNELIPTKLTPKELLNIALEKKYDGDDSLLEKILSN